MLALSAPTDICAQLKHRRTSKEGVKEKKNRRQGKVFMGLMQDTVLLC